jgi:cytochrome c biogenesis protein CcmG, thiol:disulfide interchange protein DsbE
MRRITSKCTSNGLGGCARIAVALGALAAAVAVAACGTSTPSGGRAPDYTADLKGSPPKLAALHKQSDELLSGGTAAFEKQLKELRGFPVVVNKWASWCGPCRSEFPYFQSVSAKDGTDVAFLGVNSNDGENSAKSFVDEFSVPYPSFVDPDQSIAKLIGAPQAFPATAFYGSDGKRVFVHQGTYASEQQLTADIKRYAGA